MPELCGEGGLLSGTTVCPTQGRKAFSNMNEISINNLQRSLMEGD
jgi:hypothetical protein